MIKCDLMKDEKCRCGSRCVKLENYIEGYREAVSDCIALLVNSDKQDAAAVIMTSITIKDPRDADTI